MALREIQRLCHGRPEVGGRIKISGPAGPKIKCSSSKLQIGQRNRTTRRGSALIFGSMRNDDMGGAPANAIIPGFPGRQDTIHVQHCRQRRTFFNQAAHPIGYNSGQSLDFIAVINDLPVERLGIMPGRRVGGHLNQSGEKISLHLLLFIYPHRSSEFQKLFELEGVNLRLTDSALQAIATEAIKRKSGARGLRSILETCMLDIMYEIPSIENVKECVISEDVVLNKEDPILLYEQTKKQA